MTVHEEQELAHPPRGTKKIADVEIHDVCAVADTIFSRLLIPKINRCPWKKNRLRGKNKRTVERNPHTRNFGELFGLVPLTRRYPIEIKWLQRLTEETLPMEWSLQIHGCPFNQEGTMPYQRSHTRM